MKKVLEKLKSNEKIMAMLIGDESEVYFEYYSREEYKNKIMPLNSITKSIVSLVLGKVLEEKYITDLSTPISEYIETTRKRKDTVKEHLTMSSGMDWGEDILTEQYNLEFIRSKNWVEYILAKKIYETKRGKFKYNGGSSCLISKVISSLTNMKMSEYGNEKIFSKLGIEFNKEIEPQKYNLSNYSWTSKKQWDEDPQGNAIGSFGLSLKAMDLFKIGLMVSNGGCYKNEKIISKDYLDVATSKQVLVKNIGYYGYHWWIKKIRGRDVISALGYGNQYLAILPNNKVVVILSKSDGKTDKNIEMQYRNLIEKL